MKMPNDNIPRTPTRTPIRVLVADDDPIMRSLIASRIQLMNGVALEAEDGAAAWELQSAQSIDLAIIDLNMPNIDGFTLIRCMRNHLRTRHVPIIVVTSQNDAKSIAEAFDAGASSFLMKPVNWSTFQHHIGFLLRLVEDARGARIAGQRTYADAQAKEAILGSLCAETSGAAASMLEDLDELRRLVGAKIAPDRALELLDRVRRDAAHLADNADRASKAVDVVFDRIEVGNLKEPLSAIIKRAMAAVAADLEVSQVQITTSLPAGETLLSCDPGSVTMAIVELLRNAIGHSASGSTVMLTAKIYPDGLLAIEISDQGCGMPPERLARCLAPMRVGLEAPRESGRIGFGLPFAKAIAEAHNGKLELRSMPEQGTSALMVFPPERVSTISAAA